MAHVHQFTHLIFNRFEPYALVVVIPLLFLVPIIPATLLLTHFATPAALVLAFGVYWTALLSSIAFYRLSFIHPLSRYPGPAHLKLSTLWVYKMARAGRRHLYIQKLHEQYNSDVVRIGPNELSFRDVASIGQIMGTQGFPRGPTYDGLTAHAKDRPLVALRDTAAHAKRRLPWNRGLNTAALKEYDSALAERVNQLVDLLLSENGRTVNVGEKFRFFSYDFMGDMAFGGVSELMHVGDVHGQMRVLHALIESNLIRETIPWSPRYLPSGGKAFVDAAIAMGSRRIEKGNSRKDLFYYLNNEDGYEAVSPPFHDVVAEAALVIGAGSDTTSLALTNMMYLLMRHPQAYKRLQEEVDRFYPRGENALDSAFHPEMVFLEAVINEALRLYPVVPSGVQRCTPEGAMISSGYYSTFAFFVVDD
ncbi:hypothetical protein EUX98_g1776 [Antrodiella citrinella]|uniref:Cytochrome P450 n=1 Tax=Antrodiella citrinella TaxID=2447956 RepID=A0A4S4N0M4_9APHY|nr:hypothetical protein EUX98_g1776 [Antrodiella citrinella]